MIPELIFFVALFLVCVVPLMMLSEPETLAQASERRHVNYLADQSKKRSAPGMRPRCRYIRAGRTTDCMWRKAL